MIIHKGTYTCYFTNSDTDKSFASLEDAMTAAADYCGNNRWSKPFATENTYLFGPGDGSTSVLVREDIEIKTNKAGAK